MTCDVSSGTLNRALPIYLAVSTQYTNVTDTQLPYDNKSRAILYRCAAVARQLDRVKSYVGLLLVSSTPFSTNITVTPLFHLGK